MHESEWKEKWDLVDNDEKDTVEYDMKNTFIFRPKDTLPLTGREIVTIPHPLVMVSCHLFISLFFQIERKNFIVLKIKREQ